MKTTNSIASLGITLADLYAEKIQLTIRLSDKPYHFHVVLKDRSDKLDCKISSFKANLWGRTNKGLKYEAYNSLSTLQSALVKIVKKYVDTNGIVTFGIQKEIYKF